MTTTRPLSVEEKTRALLELRGSVITTSPVPWRSKS